MSITRSQIARQLLAEGGAPRKGFYVGGSPADSQNNPSPSSSFDDGFDSGEEFGRDTYAEQLSDLQRTENTFPKIGDVSGGDLRNVSIRPDGRSDAPSILDFTPLSLIKRADKRFLKPMRDRTNLKLRTDFLRKEGLIGPGEEDEKYSDTFLTSPAGLEMLRGMGYKTVDDMRDEGLGGDNETLPLRIRKPITEAVKKEEPKDEFDDILKFYGARFSEGGTAREGFYVGGSPADSQNNPDTSGSNSSVTDTGDLGTEAANIAANQAARDYINSQNGGDDQGGGGGGGGPEPKEQPPMMITRQPTFMDKVKDLITFGGGDEDDKTLTPTVTPTIDPTGKVQGTDLGFAFTPEAPKALDKVYGSGLKSRKQMYDDVLKADGGEVRQNYGLGSIVKKATRAVKKVAKSPIGKAAIFAGLGAYGLGAGPFAGMKGAGFLKGPLAKKIFLKKGATDFALANINPFTAILGTSLLAGGLSKQDEDDDEKLPTADQSDPEFQNLLAFYGGPRRFAEEGGDIEDAPKEKPSGIMMASNEYNQELLESLFEKYLEMGLSPKDAADKARQEFDQMSKAKESDRMTAQEGGLMNLGGNEMDLRGGGFVPLGAKEKADDVPARLSKNEFVFTADAVRAAGGGSVDRGADIMYKTMKNLENKVA